MAIKCYKRRKVEGLFHRHKRVLLLKIQRIFKRMVLEKYENVGFFTNVNG